MEKYLKIINNKRILKTERGITLMALVISIIVLLILAGVSVNAIIGENGILKRASGAVESNRDGTAEQDVSMAWASAITEYWQEWAKNPSKKKSDFFTQENLNKYLKGSGKIVSVVRNEDGTYEVKYQADDQKTLYRYKIDENGNITFLGKETVEESIINGNPGLYLANGEYITWEDLIEQGKIQVEGTKLVKCNQSLEGTFIMDDSITEIKDGFPYVNDSAFYYCENLTRIEIPSNVTNIEEYAFGFCDDLTEIEIGSGVTNIDEKAFHTCSNLKSIKIHKAEGSISVNEKKWGATNATIEWLGN